MPGRSPREPPPTVSALRGDAILRGGRCLGSAALGAGGPSTGADLMLGALESSPASAASPAASREAQNQAAEGRTPSGEAGHPVRAVQPLPGHLLPLSARGIFPVQGEVFAPVRAILSGTCAISGGACGMFLGAGSKTAPASGILSLTGDRPGGACSILPAAGCKMPTASAILIPPDRSPGRAYRKLRSPALGEAELEA